MIRTERRADHFKLSVILPLPSEYRAPYFRQKCGGNIKGNPINLGWRYTGQPV